MKSELNDRVWIIDDIPIGTKPCKECGLSKFKKEMKVTEAEISDIYSHVSSTGAENVKYRVRINGEVAKAFWRDGIDIFDSIERANTALENKKRQL